MNGYLPSFAVLCIIRGLVIFTTQMMPYSLRAAELVVIWVKFFFSFGSILHYWTFFYLTLINGQMGNDSYAVESFNYGASESRVCFIEKWIL